MRYTRPFAAAATAAALIAISLTAAVPAAAELPPPPEPLPNPLTASALPVPDKPLTTPCLEDISAERFAQLECTPVALNQVDPSDPSTSAYPSSFVPDTVVSNVVPNCDSAPKTGASNGIQVNTGQWFGSMNTVALSSSNSETNSVSEAVTVTIQKMPLGVGASVASTTTYGHSWTVESSRAFEQTLQKTNTWSVTSDGKVNPYSWGYVAFKPEYRRLFVLWSWRPAPGAALHSTVQEMLLPVVRDGIVQGKSSGVRNVPMTPAEVRLCQLNDGNDAVIDPPARVEAIANAPGAVDSLDQLPFYSQTTTPSAPILRNAVTVGRVYVWPKMDGDVPLTPMAPRLEISQGISVPVTRSITMSAPASVSFWLGGACTALSGRVGYAAGGAAPDLPDTFQIWSAHVEKGATVKDHLLGSYALTKASGSADTLDTFNPPFDVKIPAGTDLLVLSATRDGAENRFASMTLADLHDRAAIVVGDTKLSCSYSTTTDPNLKSRYTAPITGAEVDLAPTWAVAPGVNSKLRGAPTFGSMSACPSIKIDRNGSGLSCDGSPIEHAGVRYRSGIGVHTKGATITWSNAPVPGNGGQSYLATCTAFEFSAVNAGPATGDHYVEVTIDGVSRGRVWVNPDQPEMAVEHFGLTSDATRSGWGPHIIQLKVVSEGSAVEHVDIINPKLVCTDQELPGTPTQRVGVFTEPTPPVVIEPTPQPEPEPTGPKPVTMPLGDFYWEDQSNGYGPIEKDQEIGQTAANDGAPISIGGVTHAHGIGMHADGRLTIQIGAACQAFSSVVGVDDSSGDNGSVVFELWAGGQRIAGTGVLRGSDGPVTLTADVSGVTALTLVASNGGDGYDWDHASWGDPTVTCAIG